MKLSPQTITLSTHAKNLDGLTLYSELACGGVFIDWRIESVSADEIAMEIDPVHLRQAFVNIVNNSGGGALEASGGADGGSNVVTVKLAKRNSLPCLCVESSDQGGMNTIKISHDIPVKIMKVTDFNSQCSPPAVNSNPVSQLYLPADRPIKTSLMGLAKMGKTVYVEASMGYDKVSGEIEGTSAGSLMFNVFGEGASVSTFLRNLSPETEGCIDEDGEDTSENGDNRQSVRNSKLRQSKGACKVKINSKKLLEIFRWQSTLPMGRTVSRAMVSLWPDEMFVVHAMLNSYDTGLDEVGSFTYYCRVPFLDREELAGLEGSGDENEEGEVHDNDDFDGDQGAEYL